MNVENRSIYCHDNLEVLRGINNKCIDLIYLDPPFNKKKTFTAPLGSSAEGASFKDIFTQEDVKEDWIRTIAEDHDSIYHLLNAVRNIEGRGSYNFCYLAYMAIRLMECHRILKETGSLYLHCDSTMSHYLKLVLDCIFGEKNFRNEIVWHYTKMGNPSYSFRKNADYILFYTKSRISIFHEVSLGRPSIFYERHKKLVKDNKLYYRDIKNTNDSLMHSKIRVFEKENTEKKDLDDLPVFDFSNEKDQIKADNVWNIPPINNLTKERTGYPTQKPLALLERIIQASSNTGGVVLDPFCGCATTCVAAEKLGRAWIGIDVSIKAYELVQTRIKNEVYKEGLLKGEQGNLPAIHFSTDPPERTDEGTVERAHKFVYVLSHKNYHGFYKVGIASDVKSRLNSYQTSDPHRSYQLEHYLYTPHFREIEQHVHHAFSNKLEWVEGHLPEIIDEIDNYQPIKHQLEELL